MKKGKTPEIVKRIDSFFGFHDHIKASKILMNKILENDYQLYMDFRDEVLTRDILGDKNSLEFDAMFYWYEWYLTDVKKGQFFSLNTLASLMGDLVGVGNYNIHKAANIIYNFVDDKDEKKWLEAIKNQSLFYMDPMFVTDQLDKLANKYECPDAKRFLKLPVTFYDFAAGTGSLLIPHWYKFVRQFDPSEYYPLMYYALVQDISEHVMPFLLFNMAYRGIPGTVVLGDALTGDTFSIYTVSIRPIDLDRKIVLPFGEIHKHDIDNPATLDKFNRLISPLFKDGKGYFKKSRLSYEDYMMQFKTM